MTIYPTNPSLISQKVKEYEEGDSKTHAPQEAQSKAASSSPPYHPPVKHSVLITKHATSISLEPVFWAALRRAAQKKGQSIGALISIIDEERMHTERPPGLASAIRIWLFHNSDKNPDKETR